MSIFYGKVFFVYEALLSAGFVLCFPSLKDASQQIPRETFGSSLSEIRVHISMELTEIRDQLKILGNKVLKTPRKQYDLDFHR